MKSNSIFLFIRSIPQASGDKIATSENHMVVVSDVEAVDMCEASISYVSKVILLKRNESSWNKTKLSFEAKSFAYGVENGLV